MEATNNEIQKNQEYTDGKYSVYSFSNKNGAAAKRIACSQESICILPFDVNEHGQIKNVYLSKYTDYLSDKNSVGCITDSINQDEFDTYFDAVNACIKNELGLSQVEVDDVYFLGKVNHGIPFSKEYKCYGLNLSRFSDPSDFVVSGLNPNPHINSIEKVRFTRVLNGEISDSLALSCSLLLLSYLDS